MSDTKPPLLRTVEILELLQWPKVGPARAREVLAAARGTESVLNAALRVLKAAPSVEAREVAKTDSDTIVAKCGGLGVTLMSLGEEGYPAQLALIPDAPPIIYVKGDAAVLSRPAVAVVGTRDASDVGARNARVISAHAVRHGFVVVSGLAIGIDTQAHLGALDERGITVAVLAHGLHTVAPTSNRALAERILTSGGALVSEHPPGVPPRPAEFVRRNRIQSGLSLGSVMVESDVEGGAMHQANFTKAQGRVLMAVLASSVTTRGSQNEAGAKHLVATKGAVAIRGTGDLTRQLELMKSTTPPPVRDVPPSLF